MNFFATLLHPDREEKEYKERAVIASTANLLIRRIFPIPPGRRRLPGGHIDGDCKPPYVTLSILCRLV